MAALAVFQQVGKVADADFLATEVMPVLWQFSLGPLLDLQQFQAFMKLIKVLSARIEEEHTRKLSELSSTASTSRRGMDSTTSGTSSAINGGVNGSGNAGGEVDFESLVTGRNNVSKSDDLFDGGWGNGSPTMQPQGSRSQPQPPPPPLQFSWSSAPPSANSMVPPSHISRTVTPDNLGTFKTLTPSSRPAMSSPTTSFHQPRQPQQFGQSQSALGSSMSTMQPQRQTTTMTGTSIDWSGSSSNAGNAWSTGQNGSGLSAMAPNNAATSMGTSGGQFGIAPPPQAPTPSMSVQLPTRGLSAMNNAGGGQKTKQGLDKYESLI